MFVFTRPQMKERLLDKERETIILKESNEKLVKRFLLTIEYLIAFHVCVIICM